ncbi:MAG: type III-B CRISPR module RAMP protein Cmr1 [Chloroflexota bacterium]
MNRQNLPVPPPVYKRRRPDLIHQERKYKLITPLFGGGVVPNQHDPVTLVRVPAIRGHLRFWWRATCGGAYGDNVADMKTAEDQLWGSASQASQVLIDVRPFGKTKKMTAYNQRGEITPPGHPSTDYGYVAFPLEEDEFLLEGVQFRLMLTYPKTAQADIEAALWAWETFGGIGARTRRGCGAIVCTEVTFEGQETEKISPPAADAVRDLILEGLKTHVAAGVFPNHLPHLPREEPKLQLTRRQNDADAAWKLLIKKLKNFRQSRRHNPEDPRKPGRSYWPEPDAIRRIFSVAEDSRHGTAVSLTDKFPRAAFGLPIIFQFKDERDGDPPQTSLQGANHDRLASPLILRPFLCSDGAVGLAFILETPLLPPDGVRLKGAPSEQGARDEDAKEIVATQLIDGEANFAPLNGNVNVLEAFLNTISK